MINFIFTFPEVSTVENITVSIDPNSVHNDTIIFDGPIFHKPDKEGFLGWDIQNIEGDFTTLLSAETPLTKNNKIYFSANSIDLNARDYYTTITCKMKWKPIINFDLVWGEIPGQTMTASFDLNNLTPIATYSNDATNMVAGSIEWDKFFGHYPVLLKDGLEVVRLDPNDYSKDINGNSVDIESGEAGDVMIAFPKRGLSISKQNAILTISFTSEANSKNHKYYAHPHDKFYISAYDGYIDESGKLRSLSGKIPTTKRKISEFRTSA